MIKEQNLFLWILDNLRFLIRIAWMVGSVGWGIYKIDSVLWLPDATDAQVNSAIFWALAPYSIGRAIVREMHYQNDC